MTHLLNLDDYPLKEPSKLFRYETFRRNLDVINDNDVELLTAHIRYALKKSQVLILRNHFYRKQFVGKWRTITTLIF